MDALEKIFEVQKQYFLKQNDCYEQRLCALKKIRYWIRSNELAVQEAIYKDFKKPHLEVSITELYASLTEVNHAIKSLKKWMRSKSVSNPLVFWGSSSYVVCQPKGVVLIIAPWNYPFALLISPLISALAAGNCVVLKPSEMTPATANLIEKMVVALFEPEKVCVVQGDAEVAQKLLQLPFDHIFFTGSTEVGKLVMQAAAKNLSDITLELGGKSPVIIDASADIDDAAQKVAWGKYINCGQTCIAPDYVLVHDSKIEQFVQLLQKYIDIYFNGQREVSEESYGRIVNERHFTRLRGLLKDALARGATLLHGGELIVEENYMAPTLLTRVSKDSLIMQEEIFGPILPIFTFSEWAEVYEMVHAKPKPLVLYLFSRDKKTIKKVLAGTEAGGTCINECLIHYSHPHLPFGGVNQSGLGKSHGKYGFKTFSNERAVLKQRTGRTITKLIYPPYTKWVKRILHWMIHYF